MRPHCQQVAGVIEVKGFQQPLTNGRQVDVPTVPVGPGGLGQLVNFFHCAIVPIFDEHTLGELGGGYPRAQGFGDRSVRRR